MFCKSMVQIYLLYNSGKISRMYFSSLKKKEKKIINYFKTYEFESFFHLIKINL